MVAGVELQRKLLHRLRMQGEAPQADSRDEDRLAALSAKEKRLRQQILSAQNQRNEDRKKQGQQALARKMKEEDEQCKWQKANLVVVLKTESDRVAALRAEVKTYEQRLKEVLERKVLAEVMAAKMSEEEQDEPRKFAMNTGSEDEQEDDSEEEAGRALSELELSYEGLELFSIMPIPSAVRLATGHIPHQERLSKVDIPATGFPERKGIRELEAEYGVHLRNLEKVMLQLRQEQAEQAEERRCQSRLAALKKKKREEAAAAAAVAGNRFPWSIGKWMRSEKTEAPTPKVSVVSGFTNFSPYAAICRKYTAVAV
ncbi:Ttll9 [Symbiodinium sp. CCMP2592]|nr:Ttll9 [Symbiodinium sp. CCMP2592]